MNPDVIEQMPAGEGVNKPASGSYGDGVELSRLQSALPGAQPSQPSATAPAPPPMTPRTPPPVPAGLPAALFGPTTQPDIPVSTPPSMPTPVAGTAPEQRIQLLDAYANNSAFSEESRAYFRQYRDRLLRGGQ